MTPVQFSLALLGLGAGIFNSLPAATAASYDEYFIGSQNTFVPLRVKAVDFSDWYLTRMGESYNYISYLSSLGAATNTSRQVGQFDHSGTGARWIPSIFHFYCSGPYVFLDNEIGIDEYGEIKLEVEYSGICFSAGASQTYVSKYSALRRAPQRLTTLDGNQIETLRIDMRLEGAPWANFYFGYGVGLVAAQSFNTELAFPSFRPVALPPPKADGTVVEYVNTADFPNAPGGHYFYSADSAEQAALDAGAAGKFVRTGHDFAAGGFVPVCRFYGSLSPGPNSHFFTVSEDECDYLKALQENPTPSTRQQWNYEGTGLYSVAPVMNAQGQMQCLSGSVPVYRAYNNAYPKSGGKNAWDSNHRYSTRSADIDDMVAQGWGAEGIALCAPVTTE